MRFIFAIFGLIFLYSCAKEIPDQPTVVQEEEKVIVVGNDSGEVNFKIIPNPVPEVDSIYNQRREYYSFDFPGGHYGAIRITRWEGTPDFTSSTLSLYDNFIRIEGANHVLAQAVNEKIIKSESPTKDSILYTTENGLLPSLAHVSDIFYDTIFYPIAYNLGDTLVVSKKNPHWKFGRPPNLNGKLKGYSFYYHSFEERVNRVDSSVRIYDNYFPAWAGLKEKYLVFNYAHNYDPSKKPENIRIGWLKVSVGLDGSLVIHEVAHEIA